jgi:hypothetical protein
MACEQTGGRTDGHTGKESRAEQKGGAEPPRAIVHPHDFLIAMTELLRAIEVERAQRAMPGADAARRGAANSE